ncbi:MAG TPA: LysM peptidoglycan-binding domain-containing protein [Verrucomicrobiae bacterium]
MRKILLGLLIVAAAAFTASLARAQDTATQQQLDKLGGQIQELQTALALQGKQLAALEKEISDLSDKVSTPQINNSASVDDLKKLAGQVQDLAKKQQDDNDLIVKQIEKLAQIVAGPSTSHKSKPNTDTTATSGDNPTPSSNVLQNGHYYPVKDGDTVDAIAKGYNAKGVKVTTKQILAANPGLEPTKLYVGKKIFIPDPDAK